MDTPICRACTHPQRASWSFGWSDGAIVYECGAVGAFDEVSAAPPAGEIIAGLAPAVSGSGTTLPSQSLATGSEPWPTSFAGAAFPPRGALQTCSHSTRCLRAG